MDKKLEEVLYDALKPVNEPDPELNRQILDRRLNSNMKKLNVRKTAVAAAIGILVVAGGVSAYAASQDYSLLSIFKGESKEVKKSAEKLLDTNVKQEKGNASEQSKYASFEIREALVDMNQVRVQVAVKPADADKYLLIPEDAVPVEDPVENLSMEGLSGKQTIAEYAKSVGKKCVRASVGISGTEAPCMSMQEHTEKDGTLLYNITFENTEKNRKLNYVCDTFVYPPNGAEEPLKDKIDFVLKDNSDIDVVKYLPVSRDKVPGTDLVIDEVTFEKSDLEMICNVKFHYIGKSKDVMNTKDGDICFFLLDAGGKIIESNGGGGTKQDGNTFTQSWQYSLDKLPDTLTFQAKDVMEKTLYGTAEVKLAK